MSYSVTIFVVCWRYPNQIARSYGILSSVPSSLSQVLLSPAVKPGAQSVGGVTAQQVRTKTRVYYRPNVSKRLKKHGLKKRLSSVNGIKMLWRRYLKGRTSLSTWVNIDCDSVTAYKWTLYQSSESYRKTIVNYHFWHTHIYCLITFCVSRRRRKMCCDHTRLCPSVCVCVCLSATVCPHYCTDPDVTWGSGRGCPLVVHYWADLQSVHGLCCYGNITRTLVYAGCARVADYWPAGDGGVLNIARRISQVGVAKWPVTGRRLGVRSQHYCGGLDCGLPMVAFWRHIIIIIIKCIYKAHFRGCHKCANANAKC